MTTRTTKLGSISSGTDLAGPDDYISQARRMRSAYLRDIARRLLTRLRVTGNTVQGGGREAHGVA